MSYTHVLKSGKVVTTDANGNTTITKVQNGKKVTKTYNMGNLTAGTVIGDAGHVKIKTDVVHVEGRASRTKLGSEPPQTAVGPGVPVGGIAGRANQRVQQQQVGYHQQHNPAPVQANPGARQVQNQFNITGSHIGQMAIGNKGPTVFKNETKHFEAGSHNVDYKISGGNFAQANIGGQATYNNNKTKVGAFAPEAGGFGGGLTLDDLVYSDMVAERKVLGILRKGITAEDFIAVLRKGYSIDTLDKAINKDARIPLKAMVTSMLQTDDVMTDDD